MKISDIGLSTRTASILEAEGISTVDQLVRLTYIDLLKIPSIGHGRIVEISSRCWSLLLDRDLSQYPPHITDEEFKKIRRKAAAYDQIARIIHNND